MESNTYSCIVYGLIRYNFEEEQKLAMETTVLEESYTVSVNIISFSITSY